MQYRRLKKGSLSVYLSLALCVMLSLVFVCMDAARLYCGRAAIGCALEESLFSEFANYDRELYEKYGLMFIDCGYGGSKAQIGSIINEISDNMKKILYLEILSTGKTPGGLYRISVDDSSVMGYQLASDEEFSPLITEICELMKKKTGADIINNAGKMLSSSGATAMFSFDNADDAYSQLNNYIEEKNQISNEYDSQTTSVSENESKELDAAVDDPVDKIKAILDMGIFAFAISNEKGVSAAAIDTSKLAEKRSLSQGLGIMPQKCTDSLTRYYLAQYSIDFFSDYLTAEKSDKLMYQTEYLIGGYNEDAKNLKACMNKILFARMGFNYLYLISSAEKQSEISKMAFIISSLLLAPEFSEEAAAAITLAWAFAESYTDVKALYEGKKIALFKDEYTWQTSLDLIGKMDKAAEVNGNEKGLSYEEYLEMFLLKMPQKKLAERIASLIEYNKRTKENEFCIDNCIYALEVEYEGKIGKHNFSINRSYGYKI